MDTLERAARKLMRVARAALVAQDRAHHWSQFGTNSQRCKRAVSRYDAAMSALDAAEVDLEEALHPYNRA